MEIGSLIICYSVSCYALILGIFLGHFTSTSTVTAFKPKQLPKVIEIIIPFAIGIGIIRSFIPATAIIDVYLSCLFLGLVFGYYCMKNKKESDSC